MVGPLGPLAASPFAALPSWTLVVTRPVSPKEKLRLQSKVQEAVTQVEREPHAGAGIVLLRATPYVPLEDATRWIKAYFDEARPRRLGGVALYRNGIAQAKGGESRAIAHELVDLYHGELTLGSAPLGGLRVEVELPGALL